MSYKINIMLWIIIIIFALFLYTILEFFLHKKSFLSKNSLLWSGHWSLLWGSILFIVLIFITPGEYKSWGNILYVKGAIKHIFSWISGILIFYVLTNPNLNGTAAAHSWSSSEFYYFSFVVPVFEEILFRGIILMSLLNMFPILKYEEPFVMISSLLFSVFHINYEREFKFNRNSIFRFIMIFIVGNAIGYLVLLTSSLWMSILMHILINLTGSIYFNVKRKKIRVQ